MAIEKNPYASDQAGGYNMLSGDYEADKENLWVRLLDAIKGMGVPAPSRQEFDAMYDQMDQPSGPSGNPLFDPQMADDLRAQSAARKPVSPDQQASDASWQRMLQSLKASSPKDTGALPPLPPPSGTMGGQKPEKDFSTKPLSADYETREEYEMALAEWESG